MATLEELSRRIEVLEKWKTDRIAQQITFPLDEKSITILNKYFLSKIGNLDFINSSGGIQRNILLKQDGKTDLVNGYTTLSRYRANTNDYLYIGQDVVNLKQGTFANGDQVWTLSTGTPPAPITDAVPYFVVEATAGGTQIKLSLTSGGSAINITDTGEGEHFIFPFT